jgi:RHH-type proline utilization regulon transcriptional repressor/proline dehydrogenase/delta 1-pyrroline-5-carboxylate dehydrogenase
MFTGSTDVARLIAATLAERVDPNGKPIPLIAETGGQNAMIVDSSALAEQVVTDVLQSAFDSAGQRCSALRVLCLQEEVAGRTLKMLKGALAELSIGNPDQLSVDVGPVIDADAKSALHSHIEKMRASGCRVFQLPLPQACHHGTFVPPTLIELKSIEALEREVFGPVLHIVRYQRSELDALLESIKATGYGLTMGVHTRIDETIARVIGHAHVGNIYVNRNMVGAVVGVQPFGGEGLSGTGPKAGGPLYLLRLLASHPSGIPATLTGRLEKNGINEEVPGKTKRVDKNSLAILSERERALGYLQIYQDWLVKQGDADGATRCAIYQTGLLAGMSAALPGPTGERNTYTLRARGIVLCICATQEGARAQFAAVLASGNQALFAGEAASPFLATLPSDLNGRATIQTNDAEPFNAVLFEGEREALLAQIQRLARRPGPIIGVQSFSTAAVQAGGSYAVERLFSECSVSVNTAAAGGNASLMTIG